MKFFKDELDLVDTDRLTFGDVITFEAEAYDGKAHTSATHTAFVQTQKYAPDGTNLGVEVLLLAPPGSFQGQFAGTSTTIKDQKVLNEMGLSGDASRLYYQPVFIPTQLYPMVFQDKNPETSGIFNDGNASQMITQAVRIGNTPNHIRKLIDSTMWTLEGNGLTRVQVGKLRNEAMTKKFLTHQLDLRSPNMASEFDTARFDINISDAIEIGLIPEHLSFLTDAAQLLGRADQEFHGIVTDKDPTVSAFKTLRDLEKFIENTPDQLKAFKSIFDNPEIIPGIVDQLNDGIKGFDAACRDEETRTNAPFADVTFELFEM